MRRRSMMGRVILSQPTGDREIDLVLRGVVALFEEVFTDRIRGYYLFGSRHSESSIETSDIDLIVLFKGSMAPEEQERMGRLELYCNDFSAMPLSIDATGEDEVRPGDIRLLHFSTLIYGDDVRGRLPVPSIEAYTWDTTRWFHYYSGEQLRQSEILVYPLTYPDPADRFLGYPIRTYLSYRRPIVVSKTKFFTSAVFNVAAGLMVLQKGIWTANWSLVPGQYREHVGDEWTDLVVDVFEWCKRRWNYLVPEDPEDAARLEALCRRALSFENHFCRHYRQFLLDRLEGEPSARFNAAQRLSRIVFDDEEVEAALRRQSCSLDLGLRTAVQEALEALQASR